MEKLNQFTKYLFLFIITIPIIDTFVKILPNNVNNEKRDLKTISRKKMNLGDIKDYFSNYDNNFNGRSMLVNLFINFKKIIPYNSPLPQKVAIGKNGYYYLVDYNCMDDYRNVSRWKTNQLEGLVSKLSDNKKWLDSLNIPYIIVIVPEKQKIYPEYLPANISKVTNETRLDQFENYISRNNYKLNIINLNQLLTQNKNKNIYFKKDSHWNYLGAFISYNEVMKYLDSMDIISFNKRQYNSKLEDENDLDLAKIMGESFYSSEKTIKLFPVIKDTIMNFDPEFEVSDYIKRRKPNFVIGKVNSKGNKKLLMFRDSYTAVWSDYFTYDFYKSVFVWKYDFDKNMILKYKPDVVIHQVAERHLELLSN